MRISRPIFTKKSLSTVFSTHNIMTALFLIMGISGPFLANRYLGGMLSGFALAILIFSTIGRRQALKAAARIDKRISDLQNQQQYGSQENVSEE